MNSELKSNRYIDTISKAKAKGDIIGTAVFIESNNVHSERDGKSLSQS